MAKLKRIFKRIRHPFVLQEYTENLSKVYQVREELRSHIQSLPDLSQLPDVSAGLAPLPSAGDLFSLR